jgi:hypothetical protein
VHRVVGLDHVRNDIAILRTSDGHGRLELMKFHTPSAVSAEPKNAPVNTLGIRRIMFAVDDIDDVLARLKAHGAELVGEVAQYEELKILPPTRRSSTGSSCDRIVDPRMAESPPPGSPPPNDRANDLALAAFVLGLVSVPFYLYGFVSIAAVIVGVLGLRRTPRGVATTVFAATGIALGAISFVMGLVSVGVGP